MARGALLGVPDQLVCWGKNTQELVSNLHAETASAFGLKLEAH